MLKLVFEPSVYLIGKQVVNDEGVFAFLHNETTAPNWVTDTEVSGQELIEIAGRICYMSFEKPRPGGNEKYIEHILEVGHGSVLEHCVFTFILTGVGRVVSQQITRHRVGWAFSQLSQRYVDESSTAIVVPPALASEVNAYLAWQAGGCADSPSGPAIAGQDWVKSMEDGIAAYRRTSNYLYDMKYAHIQNKTARRKKAREAARSELPENVETKITCTVNARALRHFIELRASDAADHEINIIAMKLLRMAQEAAPNIFGDYQIVRTPDGREVATTPYRKV